MADNSEAEAINVTGDLSISDRMKLVQGVARGIQQQSKPQGNKDNENYLYDGNDKAFHQWWRAVINQLSGVYLDGIEELVMAATARAHSRRLSSEASSEDARKRATRSSCSVERAERLPAGSDTEDGCDSDASAAARRRLTTGFHSAVKPDLAPKRRADVGGDACATLVELALDVRRSAVCAKYIAAILNPTSCLVTCA